MLGAIIGDVVGSRFEFNNSKTKDFTLVTNECFPTDDSVLTIALMDWLLHSKVRSEESAAKYLQKWARKYPYSGYGGRFSSWIYSNDPKPYNSYGNGAAMRISSVAYASKDLKELELLSDIATGVTHNHPDGLKAARVVSTLIWMGLHFKSKEEMRLYASKYYDLNFDYDDLVRNYDFDETSEGSVPQAIYCFLISKDFEDCLRTAISIGGDSDTIAAIACSIGESYYEVPSELVSAVRKRLPIDMLEIIDEFKNRYGGE